MLNVTSDFTNNSATQFSRLRVTNEGEHIGTGGNIAANIGGDLTTPDLVTILGWPFKIQTVRSTAAATWRSEWGAASTRRERWVRTLDNTGGVIGSDTILIIASSGAISVQGDATFQILNSDNETGGSPGQIGGSANIRV